MSVRPGDLFAYHPGSATFCYFRLILPTEYTDRYVVWCQGEDDWYFSAFPPSTVENLIKLKKWVRVR